MRENPPRQSYRASDSPWFWGLLFSLVGLLAIAIVSPKYERRQGQIEGRYLGRERLAAERARRAAGLEPESLAEEAVALQEAPRSRLVPLWPLALTAGAAAATSGWMLVREVRRR